MTAALGKYLARAGHQVGIVTPLHRSALAYARRQAEAALRARVPARRLPRDPARWEAALEEEMRHVIAPFDWAPRPPAGPRACPYQRPSRHARTQSHHLLHRRAGLLRP
ncbi:MAG: hypothetical protein M5U12_05830 [Verrucomicrobia bacterium]|nr:hypothetical protein [Verrucomicrobiota bacterium]